jgi:hypothetical protein
MQRLSIEDTAVILIDHQVGTNSSASTTPLALLQRSVMILAQFAKGKGMPLVLTSSQKTNVNVQRPLMPELEAIAPEAFGARIRRTGVVNAWDDEAFAGACRQTGRRHFVMGGDHRCVHGVARDQRARRRLRCAGGLRCLWLGQPDRRRDGVAAHGARRGAADQHQRHRRRAGAQLRNWASPAGAVAFPLLTS